MSAKQRVLATTLGVLVSGCSPKTNGDCGDCASGRCDADGVCHALCNTSRECGACSACVLGYCTTTDAACLLRTATGGLCTSGTTCQTGTCVDGRCCESRCDQGCHTCAGANPGRCEAVAQGPSGSCAVCSGGVCLDSLTCSGDTDCPTHHCADAVCCETACAQACHTCAQTRGVCTATPFVEDALCHISMGGAFLCDPAGACMAPHVVAELNQRDDSPAPSLQMLALAGGRVVFEANAPGAGVEPWAFDGTSTHVLDIATGVASGSAETLGVSPDGSLAFFEARDYVHGHELYTSDGSSFTLYDVNQDSGSSWPHQLVFVGSRGFFLAGDAGYVTHVWVFDSGTILDLTAGCGGCGVGATRLVSDGTYVHFDGSNATSTGQLWRSDGFVTTPVDLGQGHVVSDSLTLVGGTPYFAGVTANGTEIFKITGTTAVQVSSFCSAPGTCSLAVGRLGEAAGQLFFLASTSGSQELGLWSIDRFGVPTLVRAQQSSLPRAAIDTTAFVVSDGGEHPFELWRSTAGGPATLVQAINPPPGGGSYPGDFRVAAHTLFFSATDGAHGTEPWRYDLDSGKLTYADLWPGPSDSRIAMLATSATAVFFRAVTPTTGGDLLRWDVGSVSPVAYDVLPGPEGWVSSAAVRGGYVYFTALGGGDLHRLWRAPVDDATQATELATLYRGHRDASIGGFAAVGGTVFFGGSSTTLGNEPYVTDGTTAVRLLDLKPGPYGSRPHQLVPAGNLLFFGADLDPNAYIPALAVTDGTSAGTRVLMTYPENAGDVLIAPLGGAVLYNGADAAHGQELWVSDGTQDGTRIVADVQPGAPSGVVGPLAADVGRVFFVANDGTHGTELWVSDGTATGTHLVQDLNPAGDGVAPGCPMTVLAGRAFFPGTDGTLGTALWRSDGARVELVGDLLPGQVYTITQLASLSGWVFVWVTVGTGGAVFVSDGNEATLLVGAMQSLVGWAEVGGKVFFGVNTPTYAGRLYASDGTPAGTTLIEELPFGESLGPAAFVGFRGRLFFEHDAGNLVELWMSDGTPAGTGPACPPGMCMYPESPTVIGERLFMALDAGSGPELAVFP